MKRDSETQQAVIRELRWVRESTRPSSEGRDLVAPLQIIPVW